MTAVILAAGMASRLRPLTDNTPKCLLKVGNKCLLQRTIDSLLSAGIDEFVVVTGYLHEMIESFIASHYPGATFYYIYNNVYESTNNIYSLWLARPFVDGKPFMLLDSDILFDPAIIPTLLERPYTCLAMNRHECGEEEIKIIADSEQNIVGISKVCSIADSLGESVGIEKMNAHYSAALFRELEVMIEGPEHLDNVFYERCFERLIPQGHTFKYVDTTEFFSIELDTPDDFAQAKQLIPEHLY